jgi:hypothetical protein
MNRNLPSLSQTFFRLRDTSLALIVPMPHSIDLSSYEKAAIDEEPWRSSSASATDDDSDSVTLLGRSKNKSRSSHDYPCSRSPLLYIIDLFLIAVIVIFATRKPIADIPVDVQLGGDVAGYVPRFSEEVVRFRSYPEFISNHSSEASLSEAREHWTRLLPGVLRQLSLFSPG